MRSELSLGSDEFSKPDQWPRILISGSGISLVMPGLEGSSLFISHQILPIGSSLGLLLSHLLLMKSWSSLEISWKRKKKKTSTERILGQALLIWDSIDESPILDWTWTAGWRLVWLFPRTQSHHGQKISSTSGYAQQISNASFLLGTRCQADLPIAQPLRNTTAASLAFSCSFRSGESLFLWRSCHRCFQTH